MRRETYQLAMHALKPVQLNELSIWHARRCAEHNRPYPSIAHARAHIVWLDMNDHDRYTALVRSFVDSKFQTYVASRVDLVPRRSAEDD
jgi:hypothetical protein